MKLSRSQVRLERASEPALSYSSMETQKGAIGSKVPRIPGNGCAPNFRKAMRSRYGNNSPISWDAPVLALPWQRHGSEWYNGYSLSESLPSRTILSTLWHSTARCVSSYPMNHHTLLLGI